MAIRRGARRGSALLTALVILLVLTLALVGIFTLSQGGRRQVARFKEDAGFQAAAEAVILRDLARIKARGWARRPYLGDPEEEGRFADYATWRLAEDVPDDAGLPRPGQSLIWVRLERGDSMRGAVARVQFREPTPLRPCAWRWSRLHMTVEDPRDRAVRDRLRGQILDDGRAFLGARSKGLPAARAGEGAGADGPAAALAAMAGAAGLSGSEETYWTKRDEGDRAMARGDLDGAETAYGEAFVAVASYGDLHGAETHPALWLRQARCLVARSDGATQAVATGLLDRAWELCRRVQDRYEGHCLCPAAAALGIRVAARSRVTDPDRMTRALAAMRGLAEADPTARAHDEDLSLEEMERYLAELWMPKMAVVGRYKDEPGAEIFLVSLADPSRLQSMTPLPLEDCYAARWLGGGSRLLALVNTETDLGVPKLVARIYERDGRKVSTDQLWLQHRMIWTSPSGRRLGSGNAGGGLEYWTIPGNLSERRGTIPMNVGLSDRPFWPGIVWSADETRMAYLDRPDPSTSRLFSLPDGETAGATPVTPPAHYALSPCVTRDGDLLYLSLSSGGGFQVSVQRKAGGDGAPVAVATVDAPFVQRVDEESSVQAHVAPTGDRMLLVFGGRMPSDDCCKVLDLDTGASRPVFQGRGWPMDPTWGPDGRKFYCSSGSWEGGLDIVEVDGETGSDRVFVSSFVHPTRGGRVNLLSADVSE